MPGKKWTDKEDLFLLKEVKLRNILSIHGGLPYLKAIHSSTTKLARDLEKVSGNRRTEQALSTRFHNLTRLAGSFEEALGRAQEFAISEAWDNAESNMEKASDDNLMLVNTNAFQHHIKQGLHPFEALVKSKEL